MSVAIGQRQLGAVSRVRHLARGKWPSTRQSHSAVGRPAQVGEITEFICRYPRPDGRLR